MTTVFTPPLITITGNSKNFLQLQSGQAVAEDLSLVTTALFEQVGVPGQTSLLVDGSSTPVIFQLDAIPGDSPEIDEHIVELRFTLVAKEIITDGNHFAYINPLVNGIALEIKSNGIAAEFNRYKLTEDFVRLTPVAGLAYGHEGKNDILTSSLSFGGITRLRGDTDDYVKIIINDDLTDSSFKYFTCHYSIIRQETTP